MFTNLLRDLEKLWRLAFVDIDHIVPLLFRICTLFVCLSDKAVARAGLTTLGDELLNKTVHVTINYTSGVTTSLSTTQTNVIKYINDTVNSFRAGEHFNLRPRSYQGL